MTRSSLAVILALAAPSAVALDLSELSGKTRPSVVLVRVEDASGNSIGNGTGFFVSPDAVVTNHHVVAEARRIRVVLADGRKLPAAAVLAEDADADLAVLQVAGAQAPPLLLGESGGLRPGDSIAVIGSPMGFEGTLSDGIVSAIRPEGAEFQGPSPRRMRSWQLQVTAPISPGSSGSPVLTRDGRVVGVAVGHAGGTQNVNFAIPSAEVARLLSTIGHGNRPRALTSHLVRNVVLSAVGLLALVTLFSWRHLRARRTRFTWQPQPPRPISRVPPRK